MSGIYGLLGLDDNDRSFVNVVGQDVVFDAVNQLIVDWNNDVNAMLGLFIEESTELFKERYYLPGGGYMQEVGTHAPAGPPAV